MDNVFFDIHMHAMDLSHPNLRAFIGRFSGLKPLLKKTFETRMHGAVERVVNLLTVMENNIEDYFLLMEYFLRNKEPALPAGTPFSIGSRAFDTIILTPLIIDFGFKHIKYNTFYNMALGKPVVAQTIDVLNAIRKYRMCEVFKKSGRANEVYTGPRISPCLFEIYPFMGISPMQENYDAGKVREVLARCFDGYTGKREDLKNSWETFSGTTGEIPGGLFAGVKLYPPLGFDPWPEGSSGQAVVKELYRTCVDRQIPVTAHCSDLGFTIDKHAPAYTKPGKWSNVLKDYPLKLNLAHFGDQRNRLHFIPNHEWRDAVIQLVLSHDTVYTDISCLAFDDKFYSTLSGTLKDQGAGRDRLSQHILFGSDFMINLMWANSYNEYLHRFIKTTHIGEQEKLLFCNENPARFLYH